MKRKALYFALAGISLSAAHTFTYAQQKPDMEEVVVTGSYIAGSPEDSAVPVDVITSEDLADVGNPSLIEMVRNLGVTSGNIGETNQFQPGAQNAAGVTTINLRGMGSARTLVLINGRRHVADDNLGVDISTIPSMAVQRLEVLKDGAAALYGSDAMAGVVNFITRSDYEGLELRASGQHIQDAGDYSAGFLFGTVTDTVHWTVSGEYAHRDPLGVKDRDWALPTVAENPQGGFSGIGNPARILPAFGGSVIGGGGPDPQCTLLGGVIVGPACQFQYTFFDNLIEEQDTYKVFSELTVDLNADTQLHFEALYSSIEVDRFTSPSYPPQSLFGPDRYVAANHPGLVDFKAQNPGFFSDITIPGVGTFPAAAQGAIVLNRYAGVSGVNGGQPEKGDRETEQLRFVADISGAFSSDINYDVSLSYSERQRRTWTDDMYVERMAFALDGLGGPNCDPATGTPGVGSCEYYNPFSNAIQVSAVTGATNPQYNAAVANSPELLAWLTDELMSDDTNDLLVFDAVFSGETGWELAGGAVNWASGLQYRRDSLDSSPADINNLAITPCPFNNPMSVTLGNTASLNCTSPTGQFAFLSGSYPVSDSRNTYGVFGELALPVSDAVNVKAALRYEDYGGSVGSTLDPKLALRWQISETVALRSSISTTFRGPPLSSLSGRITALSYVPAALAFKAIDIVGNPNLDPESATTFNLGLILESGNFYGSMDYWRFDVSDPFQVESFGQILDAYTAGNCNTVTTGDCAALRSHVFPLGTTAAGVERIETNIINGADFQTSGLDIFGEYTFDVSNGELSVGLEGTYTFEYKSDDFLDISGVKLADGGDFVGLLNDGNPFTPKPEYKANLFAKYSSGVHTISYVARYIASYEDSLATLPSLVNIDSQLTHDIVYNMRLLDDHMRLSLSILNLLDEDPPQAETDLNYDAFTHSAFGRMVKLGITYNL